MEYIDILKRRASGYYYTEEVIEYERGRKSKLLFCKRHNIIFIGGSYIKVKPISISQRGVKYDFKKYNPSKKRFRKKKKYKILQK